VAEEIGTGGGDLRGSTLPPVSWFSSC